MNENMMHSYNPATLELIWEGSAAGPKEIDEAFEKASKAFDSWSNLSIEERAGFLHQYKELLNTRLESFSEVISQETGKPLWESKSEVTSMINKIDISIEAYSIRCAERKQQQAHFFSSTRHKPHGIVVVYGPYNFPGHLPNGHIVPALLAGNTVIFKPSELTPLVGEYMIQCWRESGLPEGVINILQGGSTTGKMIASHPLLKGLFFTGSCATGKFLLEQFASHPEKILALEMGGNNPLIFHDVKDVEAAAYFTLQSAYLSTGQRCTCARRLIVVENEQSDAFIQSVMEQMKGIKIGSYLDHPEPFMGPLINERAAQKMIEAQKKLISMGAHPLQTMHLLKEGTGFITPGLMDVTPISNLPDEEYFGPLLQLIRVPHFNAAINEANRTAYGLSAGLFSDSAENYRQFYRAIKAGVVNWNSPLTGASSTSPFGGIGCSGNFRPSAFYAADYCAYPVASIESEILKMPEKISPGLIKSGK